MSPFDFINSINENKQNMIRGSSSPEAMEKQYSPFTTMRALSYHADAIMLVNELNVRGLVSFGVTNQMHYEFLLNVLPKRRRMAKWSKPEKDADIELLAKFMSVNIVRAAEMYNLMTLDERAYLKTLHNTGGRV